MFLFAIQLKFLSSVTIHIYWKVQNRNKIDLSIQILHNNNT